MPLKGWHHSDKSKRQMSQSRMGLIPWNKGITYTLEQKRNIHGHIPWNKGKQASEETRRKLSESHKGYIPTEQTREKLRLTQIGKQLSEEHKHKIAKSHLGIRPSSETRQKLSEVHKRYDIPPEQRLKMIEGARRAFAEGRVLFHKPNKAELKLESILNKHFPSEWGFTGDGSLCVGGLFPDFVHRNGKKLIIELFGDYWHGRTSRRKVIEFRQTEYGRRIIYRRHGYDLLVIWGSELKNEDSITNRVEAFVMSDRRLKCGQRLSV